jgi:hypothetical protein
MNLERTSSSQEIILRDCHQSVSTTTTIPTIHLIELNDNEYMFRSNSIDNRLNHMRAPLNIEQLINIHQQYHTYLVSVHSNQQVQFHYQTLEDEFKQLYNVKFWCYNDSVQFLFHFNADPILDVSTTTTTTTTTTTIQLAISFITTTTTTTLVELRLPEALSKYTWLQNVKLPLFNSNSSALVEYIPSVEHVLSQLIDTHVVQFNFRRRIFEQLMMMNPSLSLLEIDDVYYRKCTFLMRVVDNDDDDDEFYFIVIVSLVDQSSAPIVQIQSMQHLRVTDNNINAVRVRLQFPNYHSKMDVTQLSQMIYERLIASQNEFKNLCNSQFVNT